MLAETRRPVKAPAAIKTGSHSNKTVQPVQSSPKIFLITFSINAPVEYGSSEKSKRFNLPINYRAVSDRHRPRTG